MIEKKSLNKLVSWKKRLHKEKISGFFSNQYTANRERDHMSSSNTQLETSEPLLKTELTTSTSVKDWNASSMIEFTLSKRPTDNLERVFDLTVPSKGSAATKMTHAEKKSPVFTQQ